MPPNTPDLDRPDAVLTLVSTWDLAIPDQQRAVADLAMDACDQLVFPRPGLLSHSCMLGVSVGAGLGDGVGVEHAQDLRSVGDCARAVRVLFDARTGSSS